MAGAESRSRKTIRDIVSIAGGTALGQVLLVIATPLLTRLFDPTDFGAFGLFNAFLGIACVAALARFDIALPGAASDDDANALLWLCFLVLLPLGTLAAALYFLLVQLDLLGFGELSPWSSLLMFATVVAACAFSALRYWHMRHKRFAYIGAALARQGVGRALTPIALGAASFGWTGLALGELAGRLVGLYGLATDAWPSMRQFVAQRSIHDAFAAGRRYRNFAMVLLPSSVFDALAVAVPLPLIASAFGIVAAGEFALIVRIASAPTVLIGQAIADVFHVHFAQSLSESKEGAKTELRVTSLRLIITGCSIFIPAALLAPLVFETIFGSAWQRSGHVFVVLAPWLLLAFIVSPLSRALVVADRMQWKLAIDALFLVAPAATIWALQGRGFLTALAVFSATQCVIYAIYWLMIWRAVVSPGPRVQK